MSLNLLAFAVLLILGLGAASLIFVLLDANLRKIIDDAVKLPAATAFYARMFCITVFLSAIASVLKTSFTLSSDAAGMEYVWKIAEGLSTVLANQTFLAIAFLILVTIIVAVRKRHDQ